MKRYLIFAAVVPLFGGFWLLLTLTIMGGYWSHPLKLAEVGTLLVVFVKSLQYSYLFGVVPALMLGAVDDILFHVKRIAPTLRVLLLGVIGFIAAELIYGSRGPDTGLLQFVMYGLVGFIPAIIAAWIAHQFADEPRPQPAS